MAVQIASSAVRTCLGDGAATFAAVLDGVSGVGALRIGDAAKLNVARGYHCTDAERSFRASAWLRECVAAAVAESGVDTTKRRVVALVGTGLRELHAVEQGDVAAERLHFGSAVLAGAPGVDEVITISNACSAGGHALALAQDLIELGDADAVIVAAADSMTESMLAMIGRIADGPTDRVRPFDAERLGVLLGEGAAAVVVVPDDGRTNGLARVLATGLSCDAFHETAPSEEGIDRAMHDAFDRADRAPYDVDLVVAHGTGTALNDPTESAVLRRLFADTPGPLVTAIKGSLGHTSGASSLHSLDVAIRCLRTGLVPPIAGLRRVLPEGDGLRFVMGAPVEASPRLVQVDAFGFGGVNAVTLLERAA